MRSWLPVADELDELAPVAVVMPPAPLVAKSTPLVPPHPGA
jgi:hypothetical protein